MVHCCADLQGDWGTQFGMLIQFMSESRPGGLADPTIAELAISDLQVSQLTNSMHHQPAAVWRVAACTHTTNIAAQDFTSLLNCCLCGVPISQKDGFSIIVCIACTAFSNCD